MPRSGGGLDQFGGVTREELSDRGTRRPLPPDPATMMKHAVSRKSYAAKQGKALGHKSGSMSSTGGVGTKIPSSDDTTVSPDTTRRKRASVDGTSSTRGTTHKSSTSLRHGQRLSRAFSSPELDRTRLAELSGTPSKGEVPPSGSTGVSSGGGLVWQQPAQPSLRSLFGRRGLGGSNGGSDDNVVLTSSLDTELVIGQHGAGPPATATANSRGAKENGDVDSIEAMDEELSRLVRLRGRVATYAKRGVVLSSDEAACGDNTNGRGPSHDGVELSVGTTGPTTTGFTCGAMNGRVDALDTPRGSTIVAGGSSSSGARLRGGSGLLSAHGAALHRAASTGDVDALYTVFTTANNDLQVNVDEKDNQGATPLRTAVLNNHLDAAALLLAYGATPDYHVVRHVVLTGNRAFLKHLVACDAMDMSVVLTDGLRLVTEVLSYKNGIHYGLLRQLFEKLPRHMMNAPVDDDGNTALMRLVALEQCTVPVIHDFALRGADVSATNIVTGKSVLMTAIEAGRPLRIVEMLLDLGAVPSRLPRRRFIAQATTSSSGDNNMGHSAELTASSLARFSGMQHHGTDAIAADALLHAVRHRDIPLLDMLLKHGAIVTYAAALESIVILAEDIGGSERRQMGDIIRMLLDQDDGSFAFTMYLPMRRTQREGRSISKRLGNSGRRRRVVVDGDAGEAAGDCETVLQTMSIHADPSSGHQPRALINSGTVAGTSVNRQKGFTHPLLAEMLNVLDASVMDTTAGLFDY